MNKLQPRNSLSLTLPKRPGDTVLDVKTTDKYQARLLFQRALVDIAQAASDYPTHTFYEQLLDSALQAVVGAEAGTIIVRAEDNYFYYQAARGFDLDKLQHVRFSVADMSNVHGSLQPRLRRCANLANLLNLEQVRLLQQHGRLQDIQITLAVPIILQNRLVMVISLDNFHYSNAFDDEAVSRAEAIAAHVAALLERTELNKQLLAQQVFQEQLRNMLMYALAETDEIEFLNYVLEHIIAMLPSAQAGTVFFRVHEDSYHMVASVGYDLKRVKLYAFRSEELAQSVDMVTFMPSVVTNIGKSLDDMSRQQTVQAFNEVSNVNNICATLVIPVALANTLSCVFYLDNFHDDTAFEGSLELAQLLAAQLSIFLQRFKYERQTRLQATYQKALLEVLQQAMSTHDEAAFYHYVLAQAVAAIPGVEAGSVVRQLANGRYEYVAAEGYSLELLQSMTLQSPEALLDQDLSRSSYVLKPSHIQQRNERYSAEQRSIFAQVNADRPILTTLMLPIRVAGDLPAVMYLDNFHDEKAFDAEVTTMAEGFASQVAAVISRLRWQRKQDQYAYTQHLLTDVEALLLRVDDIRQFFPALSDQLLREMRLGIVFAELFYRDYDTPVSNGEDHTEQLQFEVFSLDASIVKRQRTALEPVRQLPINSDTLSQQTDATSRPVYIDNLHDPNSVWGGANTWYLANDLQVGSAMLIPLYQQGRLWGRYTLFFREAYALDKITLDFLYKVASNITVALEKQASREALERELLHMQAIVAANEALHSSFSKQDVFTQTVVSAQRYVNATTVFLVHDAEGLSYAAAPGNASIHPENIVAVAGQHNDSLYQDGLALAAQVLEQGCLCRISDSDATSSDTTSSNTTSSNTSSTNLLAVPLLNSQRSINGVLVVAAASLSQGGGIFIEALGQACSSALTRLRLVTAREQEATAYRALANFGATIEAINDVDTLMRLGMKRLMAQLGLEAAHTYDVHYTSASHAAFYANTYGSNHSSSLSNGGSSLSAASFQLTPGEVWGNQPDDFLARFQNTLSPKTGVIREVLEQQRSRYIETYQRYSNSSPSCLAMGLQTLLVIPVMQRKRVVKIICLSSYQRVQALSDDKLTIAQSFVRRLENAIERAHDVREVEATREATLRALGLALEYRDLETKGHSERVVNLSLAMGHKLGFASSDMQALRWGAYLHDIGKVGVPDSILLKPGKLSQDEFEVIKKHTVLGATLCSDIPFLPADAIAIVRSHHERWDGSGYPDGLANTDIPLMARVFSLVDVYDALGNARVYKEAWAQTHVIAELTRLKGNQFDPELTEVFLEVVSEQAD